MKPEEKIDVKRGKPFASPNTKVKQNLRDYVYWCSNQKRTPFLEEIALKLGISDLTLIEWTAKDKEIERIVKNIQAMQKLDYKRKALSGKYNAKIVAMLLSAEHNIVEKFKKEVSGVDGAAIAVEQQFSNAQEEELRQVIQTEVERITKTT